MGMESPDTRPSWADDSLLLVGLQSPVVVGAFFNPPLAGFLLP